MNPNQQNERRRIDFEDASSFFKQPGILVVNTKRGITGIVPQSKLLPHQMRALMEGIA